MFPAATTVRSTSGRTRRAGILLGSSFLVLVGLSTSSFPASNPSARSLAAPGESETASRMVDASEEEKVVLRGFGAG
jgi:hypothetical protein